MLRHEMDRCPLDGWRRQHVIIDGLVITVCPFCHGAEEVPCDT